MVKHRAGYNISYLEMVRALLIIKTESRLLIREEPTQLLYVFLNIFSVIWFKFYYKDPIPKCISRHRQERGYLEYSHLKANLPPIFPTLSSLLGKLATIPSVLWMLRVKHATYVLIYQVRFFFPFWYQNVSELNIQHPLANMLIMHYSQ